MKIVILLVLVSIMISLMLIQMDVSALTKRYLNINQHIGTRPE